MAAKKTKPEMYTPPKSLAACADAYYTARETRYGLNREVSSYADQEKAIKEYVLSSMAEDQTGVSGKIATLSVSTEYAFSLSDPAKFYAYIVKQYTAAKKPEDKLAAFAMMTKAVSQEVIREMWESKKTVPGIQRIQVKKISCTKKGK